MGFFYTLLLLLIPSALLFFATLNGFLGQQAQATAENVILNLLGESRGSYFLKNMTPLKDTPISRQTGQIIDQGQAAYASGSKTGDDLGSRVGKTVDEL